MSTLHYDDNASSYSVVVDWYRKTVLVLQKKPLCHGKESHHDISRHFDRDTTASHRLGMLDGQEARWILTYSMPQQRYQKETTKHPSHRGTWTNTVRWTQTLWRFRSCMNNRSICLKPAKCMSFFTPLNCLLQNLPACLSTPELFRGVSPQKWCHLLLKWTPPHPN